MQSYQCLKTAEVGSHQAQTSIPSKKNKISLSFIQYKNKNYNLTKLLKLWF